MNLQGLIGMQVEEAISLLTVNLYSYDIINILERSRSEKSQSKEKRVIKIEEKSGIILLYCANF